MNEEGIEHVCGRFQYGVILLAAIAFVLAGCAQGCDEAPMMSGVASAPAPASLPSRRILNDPDGLPELLPAPHVSIWIRNANDWTELKSYVSTLGVLDEIPVGMPNSPHWPRLRVMLKTPQDLPSDLLTHLREHNVQGHLVFWYPATMVRQRLIDGGRAGLFRGASWYCDSLPVLGPVLKTPPLLLLGAISTQSFPMDAPMPGGFQGRVGLGVSPQGLEAAPKRTSRPVKVPSGDSVRLLVPMSGDLMGAGIDQAVESLHALEQRGARAWLAIGIPLNGVHASVTPEK
jgi:hypothetical protein